MDLAFLLQAVRRYFIAFFIVIAICIGGGFAVNTFMTPSYQASASLVASISASGDAGIYNEFLASQLLTKTYEDTLKSYFIANKVKEKLNTSLSAADLLKKVETRTDPETLVVKLMVNDTNPKDAVAIANAFAETYVSESKSILQYANMTLLDRANIEQASIPVSPKKAFNLAISLFIGVFLGLSIALLLETRRMARKRNRMELSAAYEESS
ncbi:YveK family protein [Paenibacillus sp. YAF4_2]|uniref:YveK family protein n=1 Tax=Paenibacillus sp. YAF4_2 TaxID=3233085 RepID=UPI003F99094E